MRLYLIASTSFQLSHKQFLREHKLTWNQTRSATDAENLIEFAGRVCYLSFGAAQSPKTNAEYIKHLIAQGHGSVLEHAVYSVLAVDISRGLSHQLVRHRAGFSFSQLSQQYHDESGARFVSHEGLKRSRAAAKTWASAVKSSREAYKLLVGNLSKSNYATTLSAKERLRAIRSIARSVLPNATSTALVITANVRAWRHLLEVRGRIEGDLEMREFCVNLLRLLTKEAPVLFGDFKEKEDDVGSLVVLTE